MNAAFLVALVLAQNYQGYPIAPRSSGMGGTATALGNGASNTFYNPSAVAWNDESMTGDVSGNLFAGSLTTLSSQFGLETQVPRLGVQIIPSNMSFEWRGLELGASRTKGRSRSPSPLTSRRTRRSSTCQSATWPRARRSR
jgi:hypothetical protein